MSRPTETADLDLAAIRDRLAGARGPDYWRSLEELAETPEFAEFLHREFPRDASIWEDGPSRRQFLRVMGAAIALSGATGCGFGRNRPEAIVPYVKSPETMVPGRPLYFATSLTLGGYATGVLVESHMGRPTKVEGNEAHPASLGATDAFCQAAILDLYDPDRSQVAVRDGHISTVKNFYIDLDSALAEQAKKQGAGLRIVTGALTSPSLVAQIRALLDKYPKARWVVHEPAGRENARTGARIAFGEAVETRYDLAKADVVLSLDAEFLSCGPGNLPYSRRFTDRRRIPGAGMNRLYAVEATPTTAGAVADHRLPLRPGLVGAFAQALARELKVPGVPEGASAPPEIAAKADWIAALARDLRAHEGKSLVLVGDEQPPAVHALGHAINAALGNVGQTAVSIDPIEADPGDRGESLKELAGAMQAGSVDLLVMLHVNPAYTAPADLGFGPALKKVRRSIQLGLYADETAALCRWHLPATHELETWGDARAFDGTVSFQQPLIAPLYDGMASQELLAALLGRPGTPAREVVRDYWRGQKLGGDDFEAAWESALHDGLVRDSAAAPKAVTLRPEAARAEIEVPSGTGLEAVFRPDPTIWDGRFANNAWLQELPKPLTKLTWDNAARISPRTAQDRKLASGDLVDLSLGGRSVRAAVWIDPGHADGCATLSLGYGRQKAGFVGTGNGFNAYALRSGAAPWIAPGLDIIKTGRKATLATTQSHRSLEGRDLYRVGTLKQFLADPHFAVHEHTLHEGPKPEEGRQDESLYPGWEYESNAWGMVINLNACVGCNACVVACQAENNIPTVGKEEVLRSREMHWLDIDRYYAGGLDNPDVYLQPRLCMHCENAPCELVCPVAATTHSNEGLNEMTYNRCVGTRYCGNNCPYKVRHFNFFEYSKPRGASLTVLNNPDVTVRSRGVMEKCTYCVQRISHARIEAKKDGRPIREGEVVTACQASCPTRAIVFGDINDPNSEVARLKALPLNFGMLAELNTRPRTTYLARVRNPNPEIEPEARHGA